MIRTRRPAVAALSAAAIAFALSTRPHAQSPAAPAAPPSIEGAWALNHDLSDAPPPAAPQGDGNVGRGGGMGRGGFGGGFGGRGGGMGRGGGFGGGGRPQAANPDAQRQREAIRDLFDTPERLTITQSGTTVIITGADGRTTRLATDGSKISDESTGIDRRTKWDGNKLVTEISGAGDRKITETIAFDPDHRLLLMSFSADGGRGQSMVLHRVYNSDK